ncbi:hypothetical protein [Streptomyces sp. NPDC059783]|uniref:hypothetical protein n=1 Tax=Streptomyces sp. NPDC059783 TaxID=3346944 RepID=UPI00364C461B
MADLAARLRALPNVQAHRQTCLRLDGRLFEVVITGASGAAEALERMDVQQGGCGPVIQDPGPGWPYWLVPSEPLRRVLAESRPEPAPHSEIAALLGSAH